MRESDQDTTHRGLFDDLAGAEHDVLSLARQHALSFDELVDWACRAKTRRTIAGLCELADAQTQLLLSRYRLVAATRLIAQATADADTLPPEQVRKACVDLLKIELSRAAELGSGADANEDAAFESLRSAVFGHEHDHNPGEPIDECAIDPNPQ